MRAKKNVQKMQLTGVWPVSESTECTSKPILQHKSADCGLISTSHHDWPRRLHPTGELSSTGTEADEIPFI